MADVQGGITAAMPGGSFIGSLISGVLSDRFGRRYSIMVGAVIWCIGSIITAACQNIPMLIVGRIINGFSVGICSSQVPVYVSELSPPGTRGRVCACQQWAITWGILIMYFVSYGASFVSGTASFRIPWALQMLPAIGLFIGLLFTPESPRFLAKLGRIDECHQILAQLHAKGNLEDAFVQRELAEIKYVVEQERSGDHLGYLELFRPNMLYRTHLGLFTQIWSQLSGIGKLSSFHSHRSELKSDWRSGVMMYYVTYIMGMAGLTGNVNLYSASIQYVINMLMTIPALIWMDKWGRRNTLLCGSFAMMTFTWCNAAVLAVYGQPAPPGGVDNMAVESWQVAGGAGKASVAFTFLAVAAFATSIGPTSWAYPPELFPLHMRGKAAAASTSANWLFNFAISYFVPPAFLNIKWKVYVVFAVFLTTMTLHFFFFFPETSGKSLEQVDQMFQSKVKPWKTRVQRKFEHMDIEQSESASEKESQVGKVWEESKGAQAPLVHLEQA